jgi:hypothetical protein
VKPAPAALESAILAELRRLGFGSAIEVRDGQHWLTFLDGGEVSITEFAKAISRRL